MFEIILKPSVEKELDKLPILIRRRLINALAALQEDPRPRGCVKLAGTDDLRRIGVGDYRIVYTIQEAELTMLGVRVVHRKDVYRA